MAKAMDKVDLSRLRTAGTLFGLARKATAEHNAEEAQKYGAQAMDELSKVTAEPEAEPPRESNVAQMPAPKAKA